MIETISPPIIHAQIAKTHNCLFICILFIGSVTFLFPNRYVNHANYADKGHPHKLKPIENKTRSNVTIISYSKSNLFGLNASKLENVTASVKSMYLCVLFTTLIHSKKSDGVKMLVQENVLRISTVTATSVSNYCFHERSLLEKASKTNPTISICHRSFP